MSSVSQDTTNLVRLNKPTQLALKNPPLPSSSLWSMDSCLEDMLMTDTSPLDPGSDSCEDPDDSTMHDTLSCSPTTSLPSSTSSSLVSMSMSHRPTMTGLDFITPHSPKPFEIHHYPAASSPKSDSVLPLAASKMLATLNDEPLPPKKAVRGRKPTVTFDLDPCPREEIPVQELDGLSSMMQLTNQTLPSIERNSRSRHPDGHDQTDDVFDLKSTFSTQLPSEDPSPLECVLEPSFEVDAKDNEWDTTSRLFCIKNHTISPLQVSPYPKPIVATPTLSTEPTESSKVAISDSNSHNGPTAVQPSGPKPQEAILEHILSEPAPSEMLVALFDRPSEMKALVAKHSEYFGLIKSSLPKNSRDAFDALLFISRNDLSDSDWMRSLAQYLEPLPCLLQKFKAIVGWIGSDNDSNDDDDFRRGSDDEFDYTREESLEQVEIKWFRDIEGFPLEVFQQLYPQFFINVREKLQGRRMGLGGDHRDQYVVFCETLQLDRQALPCDKAWARRINGCLERHPELLLQFKEIVAYEVGFDD
ncbi:hypothetical protein BGZ94_005785 [Podila epigama]|nr:hypothetical protein BGZ94_005785 [Podila epigama]